MKKVSLLLASGILTLAACKKGVLEDHGCINKYQRPLNPVSTEALARIKVLFQNNNLNINGLSFYGADFSDSLGAVNGVNIYEHISALQYFNGLPVLNGDMGYHFKSGSLYTTMGSRYDGISLTSSPKTSLSQLRKIYMDELAKDTFSQQLTYADSCLNAELGYYRMNIDANSTAAPQFSRAWEVKPAGHTYPVALIDDQTGKLLGYFNGLMTSNN